MGRKANAKLSSTIAPGWIAKVESEAAIDDPATGASCIATTAAMSRCFIFIIDFAILVDFGFVHDDRRLVINDF
jgi:hypothetical protein